MNYLYILLTSAYLLFVGTPNVPNSQLAKAFNENNPGAILELSNDKILMTVLDTEGAYSKSQAKLILKDFFTEYPKGNFKVIHPGIESEAGAFSIGNYQFKKFNFRVTFHFKKVGNAYLIETLNIVK